MTIIAYRLQEVIAAIQHAQDHSPFKQQVKLVAVSKAQSADAVREAYQAGQTIFGENYLQEALDKQQLLKDLNIEWHFIGPIQSNKTQPISQNFDWVHSVDRLKIAQRLNDARPAGLAPLQICLQVNVSNEDSKSGVPPTDLAALASEIQKLPKLTLRGLMAIPAPSKNEVQQTAQFILVRQCYDALLAQGFALDTLSIGMSEDYLPAIAQGATFVRIGSAIFGARPPKQAN